MDLYEGNKNILNSRNDEYMESSMSCSLDVLIPRLQTAR